MLLQQPTGTITLMIVQDWIGSQGRTTDGALNTGPIYRVFIFRSLVAQTIYSSHQYLTLQTTPVEI